LCRITIFDGSVEGAGKPRAPNAQRRRFNENSANDSRRLSIGLKPHRHWKHDGKAADIQAKLEALEERLRTEEAQWEKERSKLEALLRRARE
jgi:flagellar motility protein MotE (MotC chaperone)